MITRTRIMLALLTTVTIAALLASCQPASAEPQMVEQEVVVTQVVEKEAQAVEVEVTMEARTEELPAEPQATVAASGEDTTYRCWYSTPTALSTARPRSQPTPAATSSAPACGTRNGWGIITSTLPSPSASRPTSSR